MRQLLTPKRRHENKSAVNSQYVHVSYTQAFAEGARGEAIAKLRLTVRRVFCRRISGGRITVGVPTKTGSPGVATHTGASF
jgi:hypothetical protein